MIYYINNLPIELLYQIVKEEPALWLDLATTNKKIYSVVLTCFKEFNQTILNDFHPYFRQHCLISCKQHTFRALKDSLTLKALTEKIKSLIKESERLYFEVLVREVTIASKEPIPDSLSKEFYAELLKKESVQKLKTLRINRKLLPYLPKEILSLTQLASLDLGHNHLRAFPKELCELPNLTILHLNHNHLAKITEKITQLTNLTTLSLQNNHLTKLPALEKLPKLLILRLENNFFKLPLDNTRLAQIKKVTR